MKRYVYKISSTKTDKIYIGSTNNKYRFSEHKSRYKKGLLCESSKYLFDLGIEYCSFEILEEFDCETFNEQLTKEQEYLDKFKDITINKVNAKSVLTSKEKYLKYRDNKLQYQRDNKDHIAKKEKERQTVYELCEVCNKQVKHRNMSRHKKSKLHINNIKTD